jgi:hypothetical protein
VDHDIHGNSTRLNRPEEGFYPEGLVSVDEDGVDGTAVLAL